MSTQATELIAPERLPELLSSLAEAPDLASAGGFLLEQLRDAAGGTAAALFALDGDRLVEVARSGFERSDARPLSLAVDDTGHPLVMCALSLRPVSSDGRCDMHGDLPFATWVALPYAQPQRRGLATFIPEHMSRDLPPGCWLHVPAMDRRRRLGRAPAGVVVLQTQRPALEAIDGLDRAVMLAGTVLARLAAEQTYRAAAERLEARVKLVETIVDTLPDPIVITDPANDIVVQNQQAEHLLIAGESDSGGRRHAVEINNLLFTSFLARSVMAGGVQSSARELNLVDPDEGTDLLFEVLAHPLPETGPNSGRVLSVLRNVTDLRRAAHELERQVQRGRLAEIDATRERDRLNLILENVADPILVTDDRSGIILMNDQAERLFAIGEEAPIGSARQVAIRENDTKFTSFISDFTIDKSQALRAQMRLTHPDTNLEVPMEVVSGKILNERGETMAIVSVLHDLTKQAENERLYEALKQLNSELERRVAAATADMAAQNARLQWQSQEVEKANKLKSDFLASMSHELRTPINALLGYTSLMLDRIYGDLTTGQEDGLNRIRASARHLLELISDILDLARIEAGKMPIHLSELAVSEVLGEVARQIEPMVRKKGLTFESIVVRDPPVIYTDGVKVRQILLNLLSNAVKFTPSGRVTLTTSVNGEHVSFDVADTGIGIRSQDLASIWEDFRQLDQSRTREFGGTGLGLSITRRLVEQLGGQISVRSEFGVGTTFTVQLPFRAAPGPDTEEVSISDEYRAIDTDWDRQAAGTR